MHTLRITRCRGQFLGGRFLDKGPEWDSVAVAKPDDAEGGSEQQQQQQQQQLVLAQVHPGPAAAKAGSALNGYGVDEKMEDMGHAAQELGGGGPLGMSIGLQALGTTQREQWYLRGPRRACEAPPAEYLFNVWQTVFA
eukprot:264735-Pelagomonas_calceolata.AAC.2